MQGGDEIRALRRLQREQDPAGPHVFSSERDGPMTAKSFYALISRLGERAGTIRRHPVRTEWPTHLHAFSRGSSDLRIVAQ